MFQHVCLHQSTSLPSPNCCRSVGPLGPLPSSSQFPTINLLSIRPAWARRNFRHISKKIMKKTTTKKKKSSLGLGKIRQPNTRGKHISPQNKPESRGTVLFGCVLFPGVARQARPCERCMHACIWGRETFLLFLSSVQLCEKKNVFCTKFRRGLFCGKTTIGGKTIERIVETWRP